MTRGVLIFAQNNIEIDYAKMSVFAAKRVKQYLNVPVSLVTDSKDWLLQSCPEAAEVFDNIITIWTESTQVKQFYDGVLSSKVLTWKNLARSDCYNLTPYDETLVIDSDYIISSDTLANIWDSPSEFMIYKDSVDPAYWRDTSSFQYLNQHSIPFYWATAFYFKKSTINATFFELINNIKNNWSYYKALYNIDAGTFRNDFAFSIAINMLGADFTTTLPGKMNYILDKDVLIDIQDSKIQLLVEKYNHPGEYIAVSTSNLDMHIMNKYSLIRYINGLKNV